MHTDILEGDEKTNLFIFQVCVEHLQIHQALEHAIQVEEQDKDTEKQTVMHNSPHRM